jgi:hypothetical protein
VDSVDTSLFDTATLSGMPSSELVRLGRRVDSHDETLRALSDTVLEIKDTVDQHTETLERHGEMLVEILERLPPRG